MKERCPYCHGDLTVGLPAEVKRNEWLWRQWATARGLVRLSDGREARLAFWSPWRCKLVIDGRYAGVPTDMVVATIGDISTGHPAPDPTIRRPVMAAAR